jgi:hypothetical protein
MKPFAHTALVLVVGIASVGCEADPGGTDEQDLAATDTVTAKVPGMTVWFDTTAVPEWRYEQTVWVLKGRGSKNLNSTFSFASDDEFGEALITSARKFDVVVDMASMAHLLEGNRIYVEMTTKSGATTRYFTSLQMVPRFARFSGSSQISLQETMSPIWLGEQIVWRGKASTANGLHGFAVQATDAVTEGVVSAGKGRRFDWTWANLMLASDPPFDLVRFTSTSAAGPVTKDAGIDLVVTDLQLSESIPVQDFSCRPEVRSCLQALPAGTLDTSSCGAGVAVKACWWEIPHQPSASKFAVDLSSYLGGWYGEHAQDVASSGGSPLMQAQAGVHVAQVTAITDPADDPEGHDLTKFAVFAHPDVVFPGSDTVWFGAYDRQTGQLTRVYDFN